MPELLLALSSERNSQNIKMKTPRRYIFRNARENSLWLFESFVIGVPFGD
jgi:hypothetical protein